MLRGVKTANVDFQTPGFPDYAINQKEIKFLKPRLSETEYRTLLDEAPWTEMFSNRIKVLYFHRHSELSVDARDCLDEYMEFVHTNLIAFWEAAHWLTIDTSTSTSARLHKLRSKRHDSVKDKVKNLQKKLLKGGMPGTLFDEPGVWNYPARLCCWIQMDRSVLNPDTRKPYTPKEQLTLLDRAEPARTQWATCLDDKSCIAHVSGELKTNILPVGERKQHFVSHTVM